PTSPSAARGSGTTRVGTPASAAAVAPAGSVSTAAAPAATAWAMNSAPCRLAPGRAAYRSPGWTARLSWVTPVTTPAGRSDTSSRAANSANGQGGTRCGRGNVVTAPAARLLVSTAVDVTVRCPCLFTGTAQPAVARGEKVAPGSG